MKESYQFIIDNNFQWFTYIVKTKPGPKGNGVIYWDVLEAYNVPSAVNCSFLSRLCKEEPDFVNSYFNGSGVSHQTFYGWDLCCHDFAKIKRLIELFPAYEEFRELSK